MPRKNSISAAIGGLLAAPLLSCGSDCQTTAETQCETSMKEYYGEATQKLGEEWAEDSLKKCIAEQVLQCER